jgi:hypothetical protein
MAEWARIDPDRWIIEQDDGGRSYLLRVGADLTELHVAADNATSHHFKGEVVTDEWPLGVPGEALPETLVYVRTVEHPELAGAAAGIAWDAALALSGPE